MWRRVSDINNIDVETGGCGKRHEIVRVRGQDEISIGCEKNNCGIDHIRGASPAEQHTGASARRVVQRPNLDGRQQAGQIGLPSRSSPPNLSDDATMRDGSTPGDEFLLQKSDGVAV